MKYKKFTLSLFAYLVFCNTRGIYENIKFFLLYQRVKVNRPSIEFRKNGYVKSSINIQKEIKHKVDALFDSININNNKNSSYQYLPFQLRLKLKTDLMEILNQVIKKGEEVSGCKLHLHWAVVNRLTVSTVHDEDSTQWHSDNCPFGSFKCMVLLDDVKHVTDGGFQILSKRIHTWLMVFNGFLPDHPFHSRAELNNVITKSKFSLQSDIILGSVGDVIFFDNNLLHKGNVPIREPRDTLLIQFYPAENSDLSYLENDKFEISTAPLI